MSRANDPVIQSGAGTIIRINYSFLMALLFGWFTWLLWPESRFDLGWGILAFMAVVVTGSFIVAALKSIALLYRRDKAVAQYMAQGAQPKSSSLAGGDALDDAGMR